MKRKNAPPGDWCLREIQDPPPWGEKCSHTRGQWLVEWEGKFYSFAPPTQLQKDVWLSQDPDVRILLLRWLCYECNTIQMP